MNLIFWARYLLLFFLGSMSIPLGIANTNSDLADKIKAVCLYNFAKYVEWPEKAFAEESSPIRVCVVGESNLAPILQARNDLKVKDRNLSVDKLGVPKSPEEIRSCHILYWNEEESSGVAPLIQGLEDTSILTVSDASEESMVQFLLREGKIKFRIRNEVVKQAGLNMSSQLLKLAVRD